MKDVSVLKNLQKRSNCLKSMLLHEQLKSENYSFEYFRKYSLIALNEYKKHHSFFKAASVIGLPQTELINWYVQGQMGNPVFRGFYLTIYDINKNSNISVIKGEYTDDDHVQNHSNIPDEGDYVISPYGDGWSYKTYVEGEKIFIISNELETLKKKVKDKHLPID